MFEPEASSTAESTAPAGDRPHGSENFSYSPLDSTKNEKRKTKFTTFLCTWSPKGDILPPLEEAILKWCRKQLYCYAVAERGSSGQRHIHATVVVRTPTTKMDIQDSWRPKVVRMQPGSVRGVCFVATTQYDHKWYEDYLRKESGVEVLIDKYEPVAVQSYFPTQEQQAALISTKAAPSLRIPELYRLTDAWSLETDDGSYESAIEYVKTRMYVTRDFYPITDKRRLCMLCFAMYECRNQIVKPCAEEINHAARMTGNALIVPGTI